MISLPLYVLTMEFCIYIHEDVWLDRSNHEGNNLRVYMADRPPTTNGQNRYGKIKVQVFVTIDKNDDLFSKRKQKTKKQK